MAIQRNFSRVDFTQKIDVLLDPAFTGYLESGMIMVVSANVGAGGEQLAVPCAGVSGERVIGTLWLGDRTQADVPVFEDLVIPAVTPFTLTLRQLPLAIPAGLRAYNTVSGAAITVVAGAPGAGQIGLVGKVLTADSALASAHVRISYRYAITADEFARKNGRRSVNIGPERTYNQAGMLEGHLELALSTFDTSAPYDVTTNFVVRTAAGGRFTTTGSGTIFARVLKPAEMDLSPGIEQAFVTIKMNIMDL